MTKGDDIYLIFLFSKQKALKNVTRKKPRKAATEMVTEDISSSKADASICTQTVENDLEKGTDIILL